SVVGLIEGGCTVLNYCDMLANRYELDDYYNATFCDVCDNNLCNHPFKNVTGSLNVKSLGAPTVSPNLFLLVFILLVIKVFKIFNYFGNFNSAISRELLNMESCG